MSEVSSSPTVTSSCSIPEDERHGKCQTYFGDLTSHIHPSWYETFDKAKKELDSAAVKLMKEQEEGIIIYPPKHTTFRSFLLTALSDVKCVIVGQDPYASGDATGVAFSGHGPIPVSLANIISEVRRCYPKIPFRDPPSACIEGWCEQGVLLINSSFTVISGSPGAHRGRWFGLLTFIAQAIADHNSQVPWMLWGARAAKLEDMLNKKGFKEVMICGHPSPKSVHYFEKNGHFLLCDEILINNGMDPIDWTKMSPSQIDT